MKYLSELHSQIFAIAFVGGVIGNLVANVIQSVHLHFRLNKHHERIKDAVRN